MPRQGPSKEKLARIHEAMAAHVEREELAGVVTVVGHLGQAHVDAIGRMEPAGRPIRRDTIFRISSMTKPVTAAAAMLLVDDGTIRLDEPVERLLPELADRRVLKRLDAPLTETIPATRPIAVRDLLAFTLGFGDIFAAPGTVPVLDAANGYQLGMGPPAPSSMPAPEEWLRRFGSLPLMYQPGERWMYNTGADVLSVLIARASGTALQTFLRERLFRPLGMKDTGFHVPPEKIDRLPPCYWTNYMTGKEEIYDPAEGGQWCRPPPFPSGAGGLVSTADDYFAFAQMLLDHGKHGGRRVLSETSVEAMTKDQLTPTQKESGLVPGYFDTHGWGFGMSVLTKADGLARSPGRYGWDGGMGTSWFNDPNDGLVAVLMTSRMWTSPDPPAVCKDFWKLAYEAVRG